MNTLPSLTCQATIGLLIDLHDGELSAPARDAITRHLDGCRQCRIYATQYAAVIRLATLIAPADNDEDVPEEFVEALVALVVADRSSTIH